MKKMICCICLSAAVALTAASVFAQSAPRKENKSIPSEPQTANDINRLVPQDKYALPWAPIWEENLLWKVRVWRTVDARDAKNSAFSNNARIASTNRLANLLATGVRNGVCPAYSAEDDRFTTKITAAALTGFNPDEVVKFRIKEDWMYLDTQGIVVVRILGIAPVKEIKAYDGTVADQPLFWIWYPDARKYLAQCVVQYPSNPGASNWDRLLEGRYFTSTIDQLKADPWKKNGAASKRHQ